MTASQIWITILMLVLGTMRTRFLPFILFKDEGSMPDFIKYLGDALPPAVFGMLVIYCLKGVDIFSSTHGLPEFVAVAATGALHLWKKNTLLSIAGGTAVYMIFIRIMA